MDRLEHQVELDPHTNCLCTSSRVAIVCTEGRSGTRQSSTLTEDAGHLLDTCKFSRCRRPCFTTTGLCHADSGMRNHINTGMSAGTAYYSMNTSTHLHKQKHAFLRPLSQLAHTCQGLTQTFNTWQKTDSNGKHCRHCSRHLYREFSMWRHDQLFIIDHVEKGENRIYRYMWSLFRSHGSPIQGVYLPKKDRNSTDTSQFHIIVKNLGVCDYIIVRNYTLLL